jgi:hypothetical protein
MRKNILRITFSVLLLGLLSASASASVNIGIHAGFKFATDTLYQQIYGSSNPSFGVTAGIDLFWRFQLVGEYNYFSDKGATTISKEEITFTNQSWNIGLRAWLFTFSRSSVYIGFGAVGYSYAEDLPDRFEDFDDKKTGLYFEIGDYYPLVGSRVFLDLNIKYEKVDVQPFNDKIGLGGFRAALGIRYYF